MLPLSKCVLFLRHVLVIADIKSVSAPADAVLLASALLGLGSLFGFCKTPCSAAFQQALARKTCQQSQLQAQTRMQGCQVLCNSPSNPSDSSTQESSLHCSVPGNIRQHIHTQKVEATAGDTDFSVCRLCRAQSTQAALYSCSRNQPECHHSMYTAGGRRFCPPGFGMFTDQESCLQTSTTTLTCFWHVSTTMSRGCRH